MNTLAELPLLRTLAPLLRGLERHFRAWLEGRRVMPVTLVQRAEMEGLTADLTRRAAAFEEERPTLVIMLMGGTGVGKSTLLNALAGAPVAQASFTRPTTRDPVVYHHHTIAPESLDPALRLCRLVSHDRDELAQKILVDTPDLDSNDLANRDKLQMLLPVADIVLYVGSQEKYHDRVGWELFKAQRRRRAFAFVLNKWDRCIEGSATGMRPDDDLLRDLRAEGFDEPRLFRTTAQNWLNGTPHDLPPGEQFRELVDWLELGLTRREIEAVKARGVLQLLAQAKTVVETLKPPLLTAPAKATTKAWPAILDDEADAASEILAGAVDPASSEIEQHFSSRGQQRFRGLMAGWLRFTSMRWGLKNLLRAPLPSMPRFRLEGDDRGLDFSALAFDSAAPIAERVLVPRLQSLSNRLLVEADRFGMPAALLADRLAAVRAADWPEKSAAAVAAALLDVERECIKPTGLRAALKAAVTFLANYLPDVLLLGSLCIVLWQFIGQQQVPSLAMMLMPIYVTLGALILLQLLMALLFPVKWSFLRGEFRKRLERRIRADYEHSFLPLPRQAATEVAREREAVEGLANEVQTVLDWLAEKETAAGIDMLYGR